MVSFILGQGFFPPSIRSFGNALCRIDVFETFKIEFLDMLYIDEAFNWTSFFISDIIVDSSDPFIKIGIAHDHLFVAFEINNIDGVKSYQTHEQSQVCLRKDFTK